MSSERSMQIAAKYTNPTRVALAHDIDDFVEAETAECARICKDWSETYDGISRENMALRGQYVKALARMMRMTRRFAVVTMVLCVAVVALCGVIVWMAV